MSQSKAEKKAGAEFIRRHKIGTLVSQLCTVLPKSLVCKNSRQPDILRTAIKYIKECQECQLPSLEDERERKYALKINSLENYIKDLETRCQRYAHLLDINGICKISHQSGNSNNLVSHEKQSVFQPDERKDEQDEIEFSDTADCSIEDNVENSGATPNLSSPVILLVEQRCASGRPKRPRSGLFPSALKLPKLRPKSDDTAVDIAQCTEPPTAAECPLINDGLESIDKPLSCSSVTSIGEIDERAQSAIVVNIDRSESPTVASDPVVSTLFEKESVSVGTDAVAAATTSESEAQTDFEASVGGGNGDEATKFVDRAVSPCVFEEDRSSSKQAAGVKKIVKKCNTDAIAEIVSFVATNVNPIIPSTFDKPTDDAGKPTAVANNACPPAVLRVEDMLHQPVVAPAPVNSARASGNSNKRSSNSKQSSAKRASADKSDRNFAATTREYLPNFTQSYSHSLTSNGQPPIATIAKQGLEAATVTPSNKRGKGGSHASNSALGRQQVAADFSIDSLSGDLATIKSRSNTSSHKAAASHASKLTHFPCSTASNVLPSQLPPPSHSNSSTVPHHGMPMYSEMQMFLPFPHHAPPPSAGFHETKSKMSKQQQQQQQQQQQLRSELSQAPSGGGVFGMNPMVNNPLIPTDGSQEVNLNNSIFDLQASTGQHLMQPYNTGQPVNFYNFSTVPKISSNAANERASDLNSMGGGWQCSADHPGFVTAAATGGGGGGATHPYAQSLEALQQSAGQKVQNFQIASMFPESTATSLANARTLQQHAAATYRWNETVGSNGGRFPTAVDASSVNSSMSSLPGQQYSGQDPAANAWSLPQVFPSYTNHERSSTSSFMPSFNFSQPNNHS